jgi:phosphoglycolate phosphatase-like HAD superfamily hydrolase
VNATRACEAAPEEEHNGSDAFVATPQVAAPRAEGAKTMIVLFDVDGTLIDTGGSGARSWRAAFKKLYGVPADIDEYSSPGQTDPQVALATFRGALGRDPAPDELGKLYAQYLMYLSQDIWISERYGVLPGAEQILARLGDAGVMTGLVSGALEGAARTKLMPANLNRFLIFGAYGSDSPDRAELTGLAIEKATRMHTGLSPAQAYVVGDTPLDIDAAKAAGAVSIGVASGAFSTDQLESAGADHVLGSLEDPFPGL